MREGRMKTTEQAVLKVLNAKVPLPLLLYLCAYLIKRLLLVD
jgi:hypothetical protein